MDIIQDFIPLNTPKNRRNGKKREIKYIVVHNTGNPKSTARDERAWLTNSSNDREASYNLVVDEKEIISCIPDNEMTWNAGDGGTGKGNVNGLSIEICESGNYKQSEYNAIKLIAQKMVEHKLTISQVKPHQFFTGKNCPRLILPRWFEFIASVKFEYDNLTKKEVRKMEEVKLDHWGKKYKEYLETKGYDIKEERYDDKVTRAELFAFVAKKEGFKEV